MRTRTNMFPYQEKIVFFQSMRPTSAIWAEMGLGKTIATLTTVADLISMKYLKAVLVIAPIRVCRLVWKQEAAKWDHTQHLKFSSVLGTGDQRSRALTASGIDVFMINYENLKWLSEMLHTYYISKGKELPFDGVVFDEISKMKNSSTKRVHALMKVMGHIKWTTGLTGTPASNGYKDLHGQYLVLDGGVRLGTSKTAFKNRFYMKQGFKEIAFHDTETTIKALIGDMTLEMSAADYNPLPDMIVNDVVVELDPILRAQYDFMEKELFLKLDTGTEIEVFNQASLTNKCLQFAQGAMYPVAGMPLWENIHDLKLDALEEIIDESQGQPVLCSYAYRSDAERIMTRFKHLRPINLTECKSEKSLVEAMRRWTTGDCALMIGHPASMGHGVDGLQKNGHVIVWFGLTWSLDLYEQFNARIRRQGQGAPVICHRILCSDTLDQAQVLAMTEKASVQNNLRKAIKDYRRQKEGLTT